MVVAIGALFALATPVAATPLPGVALDRDGDGKADPIVVSSVGCPNSSVWHWATSSGFVDEPWTSSDCTALLAGDVDGDHRADAIAVQTLDDGDLVWTARRSSDARADAFVFGHTGDVALVGDVDGDGRTDAIAMRRNGPGQPTEWFMRLSSGGYRSTLWGDGNNEDFPALADYDADGRTDIAVARKFGSAPGDQPSLYWWVQASSPEDRLPHYFASVGSGYGAVTANWGAGGDLLVPGDYLDDGRADAAVVRAEPGGHLRWYVNHPSQFGSPIIIDWGDSATDVPVPADYDGDGRTDIAIWRHAVPNGAGQFWIRRSSDGGLTLFDYGKDGRDLPLTTSTVIETIQSPNCTSYTCT
ncbi:MAG: hypothetical protein QOD92_2558 [Acidimicrobiaceae bacterium]|jgi:hypothetical protein